jgi:hypothetical protein
LRCASPADRLRGVGKVQVVVARVEVVWQTLASE